MAKGAGYRTAFAIHDLDDFKRRLPEILKMEGPVFVELHTGLAEQTPMTARGGVPFPSRSPTSAPSSSAPAPPPSPKTQSLNTLIRAGGVGGEVRSHTRIFWVASQRQPRNISWRAQSGQAECDSAWCGSAPPPRRQAPPVARCGNLEQTQLTRDGLRSGLELDLVPPQRPAIVTLHLPRRVVDEAPAPPVLDLEA